MKTNLKVHHDLFIRLADEQPVWWQNLHNDPSIYINIRKGNYINAYFNGGSILKLELSNNQFTGKIHFKYVPLVSPEYVHYKFEDQNISLETIDVLNLNNFDDNARRKIKRIIKRFYPNNSEKGIQGRLFTTNNNKAKEKASGFFIDSEFQSGENRIDMVWINLKPKRIYLIELKTVDEQSLNSGAIRTQIERYYHFAKQNNQDLMDYYIKVFQIMKNLDLLPEFVEDVALENYKLVNKPILLVGDCTNEWIKRKTTKINALLFECATGCFYQGFTTTNFIIPDKTNRHRYIFEEDSL